MLIVVAAATRAAIPTNATIQVGRKLAPAAASPPSMTSPVAGSITPCPDAAPMRATMTPMVRIATSDIPTASTRGMFRTGSRSSSPISMIIANPWKGMYSVTIARKNGASPSANGSPSPAGNTGSKLPASKCGTAPPMKASIPATRTATIAIWTFASIFTPT